METIIELNQYKNFKHPLIILTISVPLIIDKPSWIYSIEYNCYTVRLNELDPYQNPIINQIDVFIPSLSPDINLEYRSIESCLPFPTLSSSSSSSSPSPSQNQNSFSNPHDQFKNQYQNIFSDSIVSTINTELLADSYLQEMQVLFLLKLFILFY